MLPGIGRPAPTNLSEERIPTMCDFSLQATKSRPAAVGDKLVTTDFGHGTRGFAEAGGPADVAVCVMPGTELAFDADVRKIAFAFWKNDTFPHKVARFRQVNKDRMAAHHDALEFPDGVTVLLTMLREGQTATVLQMPAPPKTADEAKEQERLPVTA
jgi:hypothetical protein